MREYSPGRPLVFSHIPKTAGTSLRAALAEALRPQVLVHGYDTSLFSGYHDDDDIPAAVRSVVYLSPEELPATATLVAGHISPWTTMQRYPGADHLTVLRAPQVRLISQFLHGRSVTELQLRHWGTAAEGFRAGWAPLRDYLTNPMVAPNTDNTITRFLAWPHPLLGRTGFLDASHDDELCAAAMSRLDQMDHVNLAENEDLVGELSAWLGRPLEVTRLNERSFVPRRRRPDLESELAGDTRELLDHRVRIDVRVWEQVARRVLPGADPAALLDGSIAAAVERYSSMLQVPDERSLLRRVAERAYEVRGQLQRRRRTPRPPSSRAGSEELPHDCELS